jgi:nucleoside 2-deoxyribosyltransferase
MSLKIYFAGSIRGGRQFADDYQKIIDFLAQYGNVLTEHIANANLLANEVYLSDKEIHDRDIEWLKESDCVVAEVTQTSLGVGYELATAFFLKKPVLCLFNPSYGNRLSAMIIGQSQFVNVNYQTIDEAQKAIHEFLSQNFTKQI